MKQKTILITGATGGIGQGIAKYFNERDFRVVGVDHIEPKDNQYIDDFVLLDLNSYCSNEQYRQELSTVLLEKCESLDALINNAAVQLLDSLEDLVLKDWQTTLNVNLTAPLLLSQLFLSKLQDSKGSIVNIGSIHQQLTKPEFISYATSKSALIGLTKSMAVDLKGKVRVNAISPAAISTDMLLAGFNGDQSSLEKLKNLHPTQSIGKPEDVAKLVFFLVGDSQGFIHGANLTIDGGISSVLHDLV